MRKLLACSSLTALAILIVAATAQLAGASAHTGGSSGDECSGGEHGHARLAILDTIGLRGNESEGRGGGECGGDGDHGGRACTGWVPPSAPNPPTTTTIEGTPGPDVLVGTPGPDLIYGRGGNDRIRGLGGADHVIGGAGEDTIEGEGGNDNLWGGPGNDTIRGGSGNDHVVGENGRDRLEGEAGEDKVLGGSADDQLYGGADCDSLDGDNAAPTYGYGLADYCDGGSGVDLYANCERRPGGPGPRH